MKKYYESWSLSPNLITLIGDRNLNYWLISRCVALFQTGKNRFTKLGKWFRFNLYKKSRNSLTLKLCFIIFSQYMYYLHFFQVLHKLVSTSYDVHWPSVSTCLFQLQNIQRNKVQKKLLITTILMYEGKPMFLLSCMESSIQDKLHFTN